MKNFIDVFQELLDENSLTIKSFARKINMHWSVLYAYKNNNYLPSLSTAVKIANYFNCSLNYLMGLDELENKNLLKNFDITKFYPRYNSLLKEENISHFTLSKKIKLNTSSLIYWKCGKVPKMDSLIKIANYFDVSIDYLVGRSDRQ